MHANKFGVAMLLLAFAAAGSGRGDRSGRLRSGGSGAFGAGDPAVLYSAAARAG